MHIRTTSSHCYIFHTYIVQNEYGSNTDKSEFSFLQIDEYNYYRYLLKHRKLIWHVILNTKCLISRLLLLVHCK